MKPVAWIKVRELTAMKAVAEHGMTEWKTNLGLSPEPDDEGLYTETQVQMLLESFDQSVTDPENQPSQYGTVPLEWHERDTAPQPRREVRFTDEEIRDLWSWSMTAEAERTANTQQHAFARAVIAAYKTKQGEMK